MFNVLFSLLFVCLSCCRHGEIKFNTYGVWGNDAFRRIYCSQNTPRSSNIIQSFILPGCIWGAVLPFSRAIGLHSTPKLVQKCFYTQKVSVFESVCYLPSLPMHAPCSTHHRSVCRLFVQPVMSASVVNKLHC